MSEFSRPYPLFSVCGLNCGLCSMYIGAYCPGCGGGLGNQPCKIARCSINHGVDYCFECDEYPCAHYDGIGEYDSFITHRHQCQDLEKAKAIGIDAYQTELEEKMRILSDLLENYDTGRKKSFYCLAVNLLALEDVKAVIEKMSAVTNSNNISQKEKSALMAEAFERMAAERAIELKLNKKPKKNP